MLSLRLLLWLGLPLLAVTAPPDRERTSENLDDVAWEQTLNSLPGDSLSLALEQNLKPQYQGGVFENEHSALQAVHSDDPQLASKLADLAKQDADIKSYLRIRQNNVTTTTTTTTTITSTSSITTTTTTSVTTTSATASSPSPESSPGQSSSISETSSPIVVPPSSPSSTSTPTSTSPPNVEPSDTTGEMPPSPSNFAGSSTFTTDSSTTSIASSSSLSVPADSSLSASEPSSTVSSSGLSSSWIGSSSPSSVPDNPATSTTAPSIQTGVIVPVPVTSTSDGSVFIGTSSAFQPSAPTSVAVPVTSNGVVTTSMVGAIVQTFTDGQGGVSSTVIPLNGVTVASGGSVIGGLGAVSTSTGANGNVVTVTSPPEATTVSQLDIRTTVLPNGSPTVITSYAQVGALPSTADADAGQSSGSPELQSGAAAPSSWYAAEVAIVMGAAIGVAGMVL